MKLLAKTGRSAFGESSGQAPSPERRIPSLRRPGGPGPADPARPRPCASHAHADSPSISRPRHPLGSFKKNKIKQKLEGDSLAPFLHWRLNGPGRRKRVPQAGPRASRSSRHGGSSLASPPPGPSAILSLILASPSPSRTPRSSFPPRRPSACRRRPGSRGWSARRPSDALPAPERRRGEEPRCRPRGFSPAAPPSHVEAFILPGPRPGDLLPEESPAPTPLRRAEPRPRVPRRPARRGKPFGARQLGARRPRDPSRFHPISAARGPGSQRGSEASSPSMHPLRWAAHRSLHPPTFLSGGQSHRRGGGEVAQLPANLPPVSELREEKRWPRGAVFVPPGLSQPRTRPSRGEPRASDRPKGLGGGGGAASQHQHSFSYNKDIYLIYENNVQ